MCCYFFRSVSQARAERRKKSKNFHGPSLQKSWKIPSLLLTEGFLLAKTTSFNRNNFFRQKHSLLAEILSFDSICRNKMLKNPSYSFLQKQTKSLLVDHYIFCWHYSSKWKAITDVLGGREFQSVTHHRLHFVQKNGPFIFFGSWGVENRCWVREIQSLQLFQEDGN